MNLDLKTIEFRLEDRIKVYVENILQENWYFDIINYGDYWISKALEQPFILTNPDALDLGKTVSPKANIN